MPQELFKQLGARIKELRKNIGISQESLAEAARTSSVYLSRIEAGKQKPSINTLDKLANAMNVPLSLFFLWEKEQTIYELALKIHNVTKKSVKLHGKEWQKIIAGIQHVILDELTKEAGLSYRPRDAIQGFSLAAESTKRETYKKYPLTQKKKQ